MKPKMTESTPAFISRSNVLDTSYCVYVSAPETRRNPGPWPVVLIADGDYFFDVAVASVSELRARNEIPPVVVAGIGYGQAFGSTRNRRGRDYTPTAAESEPESGGAVRFLEHLTLSLVPELARRYPLRANDRILAGHSLGGLLALAALFQPQPFFPRFLVGAPSIWWDERCLLGIAGELRDRQSTLPAKLFIGVGEDETPSMTGDLDLLRQTLAARPFDGLEIISQTFPGRNHYNVLPELFQHGLRALLPGPAS